MANICLSDRLFGGGYGDYTYDNKKTDTDGNITYDVTYKGKEWDADAKKFKEVDHKLEGITKPEVDSVSVNIRVVSSHTSMVAEIMSL